MKEQYKELQKKFKHFQISDNKKFREIWMMNEEDAKKLVHKILQADKIIYEQQLGLNWHPPSEDVFKNVDPDYFQFEEEGLNISGAEAAYEHNIELRLMNMHKTQGEDSKESLAQKFQDHRSYGPVKHILEALCNEAGFLVEEKLLKLLLPLKSDEQSLMKLDSIFKALAIENVDDIERLTGFFQYTPDKNGVKSVNVNEAISSIKKYLESTRKAVNLTHTLGKDETVDSSKSKISLQKEYWDKIANVKTDENLTIWDVPIFKVDGLQIYGSIQWHFESKKRLVVRN